MPKLFTKEQFFAFLTSFLITFILGIFIWNFFAELSNRFFDKVAGRIDNNFLTASLPTNSDINKFDLLDNSENIVQQNDKPVEEMTAHVMTDKERQELLDDISEKLDVIKQEVAILVNNTITEEVDNPEEENEYAEPDLVVTNLITENPITVPITMPTGGVNKPVYPNILISEVKIAPINERFIELYNPNDFAVNLTDWYLQRKTKKSDSWSSLISSSKFQGKAIGPLNYFLISREDISADILLDLTLTEDNSLALKNPNEEISDKLGFGDANDYELLATINPAENQSIGRKLYPDKTEQDTNNNLADFELQTPTPKALNISWVLPEEKDTIVPNVEFTLNATQNSLNFLINFTITDIADTVTPSGIASYIFRWKDEIGDWQEDAAVLIDNNPLLATGTKDFTGLDNTNYYFQIKTKDFAGNESVWLPETPIQTKIIIPKKVLINEIQIAPIGQRFVELYNPNSTDIDLTGWYLQRKDENDESFGSFVSSTNFEGKIILANGYFLISREIIDSDILFDITLSENNSLALKNSNREIVDKVGFGLAIDFEAAPALNPDAGKSIGRKELGLDTDENSQDFIIFDIPTPGN